MAGDDPWTSYSPSLSLCTPFPPGSGEAIQLSVSMCPFDIILEGIYFELRETSSKCTHASTVSFPTK